MQTPDSELKAPNLKAWPIGPGWKGWSSLALEERNNVAGSAIIIFSVATPYFARLQRFQILGPGVDRGYFVSRLWP